MLAGFVAGEGYFSISRRKTAGSRVRSVFVFGVEVAERDSHMVMQLREILGVGSCRGVGPRRPGWQPTFVFTVNSIRAHQRAVIPFAERFLHPGLKRRQFERWRDELATYTRIRHPHDRAC